MFTVTTWSEGSNYRPHQDRLRGYLLRRRLPLHLWLLQRWFIRAHHVPGMRRLIMWREWCSDLERWFDGRGEFFYVWIEWDELSPEYRAKRGPRWERRRAFLKRWRATWKDRSPGPYPVE